jgi:hypothetical protein
MYSDWRLIPVPARLASRPRDDRGYPIPATVLVDSATGKPDFRVTDIHKWVAACSKKTCSLCGDPLGRHLAFLGGPGSFESRYFTDLPMHRECAEYALQVCPYLAVPNFKYSESITAPAGFTLNVSDDVDSTRPSKFALAITMSYQAMRTRSGTFVVQAAPWEQVSWWQDGKCVEPMKQV